MKKLISFFLIAILLSGCSKTKQIDNEYISFGNIIDSNNIEPLYYRVVDVNCTDYLNFMSNKEYISASQLDNVSKLNYIFRYMEYNDILSDNITFDDYKDSTHKTFGIDDDIIFEKFPYKNHEYYFSSKGITRKKINECKSNYYSKMTYTMMNDINYHDIIVTTGIIKNNEVYALDNELIDKFDTEENALRLLDTLDSITYHYKYNEKEDFYYLDSISKYNKDTKMSWETPSNN